MAKTLKEFLEESKQLGSMVVKNPDEQKFVDKHVVAKVADRNGNGDDVFKGSTKKADRKKERHGYEPGEDEKVYESLKGNQHKLDKNHNGKLDKQDFKKLRKEEAEQIDELSTKKLSNYRNKSLSNLEKREKKLKGGLGNGLRYTGSDSEERKISNRVSGIERASEKLKAKTGKYNPHPTIGQRIKNALTREEAEQIDELSTPTLQSYRKKARAQGNAIVDKMKMGGGDWSKDQKDTKTLRKRAAGAQASGKQLVKRGESLKTEEAEQIDELSHDTLRRYRMKSKSIADNEGPLNYREKGRELAGRKTYGGRMAGIEKAKVMAKEEVEDLDESAKVAAHLIKRYGDNVRKSHVRSAANDFGVGYVALAHAVRKKLGVNRLEEEQIDELSSRKLKAYAKKADKQARRIKDSGVARAPGFANTFRKRQDGADLAYTKLSMRGEEVEQIDELSQDTMARYVVKAGKERDKLTHGRNDSAEGARKYFNRKNGVRKAIEKTTEEAQIDEKLSAKSPMGTYIKDFQKSDAPQFKGKSKAKRTAMAVAAKYSAERGGKKLTKEEKLENLIADLSESHKRTLTTVYEKLSEENKIKFVEACKSEDGIESMLDFAINNRGE